MKNVVPEAKEALNRFKMEAASEVGVNLKQGYNGDLTSKQAGSVGEMCIRDSGYTSGIRLYVWSRFWQLHKPPSRGSGY